MVALFLRRHLLTRRRRPAAATSGGWPRHAEVFAAAADADIREDRVLDRPSLDPEALAAAAAGAAGGGVTLVGDALHPMIPSTGA